MQEFESVRLLHIWLLLEFDSKLTIKSAGLSNCKATTSDVLEDLLASCHSLQKLSLKEVELTSKMVAHIFQNRQTCATNLKDIGTHKLSRPDKELLWNIEKPLFNLYYSNDSTF